MVFYMGKLWTYLLKGVNEAIIMTYSQYYRFVTFNAYTVSSNFKKRIPSANLYKPNKASWDRKVIPPNKGIWAIKITFKNHKFTT